MLIRTQEAVIHGIPIWPVEQGSSFSTTSANTEPSLCAKRNVNMQELRWQEAEGMFIPWWDALWMFGEL
jgi:hypothetical protein